MCYVSNVHKYKSSFTNTPQNNDLDHVLCHGLVEFRSIKMDDPQTETVPSKQQTGSNKKDNRGTRKRSKNAKRKIRRKRKEFKYYQNLKKQRLVKKTELVDSVNMDRSSALGTASTQLPADVTEWQKLDQIAFWKSRALGLELENRMLRQHLKNTYAKTIEDYIKVNKKKGKKTTRN